MINIAKNIKGEYANKLATLKLIAYNNKMPTNNMIRSKSWEYSCFCICNVDVQVIGSIWSWSFQGTKRTPQQDATSNNATQDDEQHNAALGWQNHEKTQKKKLDLRGSHLFWLKESGKKMHMSDFRSKNDLKSPLLDEWKRKKT
jgi:hypothetical protein